MNKLWVYEAKKVAEKNGMRVLTQPGLANYIRTTWDLHRDNGEFLGHYKSGKSLYMAVLKHVKSIEG